MSSDDVTDAPAPVKRPKQRRMRDMALSIAVLLVPLGIFYWAWDWAAADRQVTVVDTAEDRASAAGLGLDVVTPELAEDWKPIASGLDAEEDAVTLRTGWYSPEGYGLQVVQTTGAASQVHPELSGSGEPVEAGGLTWAEFEVATGLAWTTEIEGSTLVLVAESDAVPELPELARGVADAIGA